MILKDDIFPIGQISKPHGVNGEMSFQFSTDIFDSEGIDFFILEIEGIFVPFYIEEYRFKSDTTGLLKLEGIDNEENARELTGLNIYVEKKYIDKVENTEIGYEYFTGFIVTEHTKGELGTVAEVDDTTENTLLVIEQEEDELLIPLSEEYIENIDHKNKVLYLNLPEGLLDL